MLHPEVFYEVPPEQRQVEFVAVESGRHDNV
jgi:hypothetical protein